MSFAEFGGNNNTNKRRTQQQQQQQQQQQPSSPYNRGGGGPLGLDSISESLLQYQRNVDILGKIVRSLATSHVYNPNNSELCMQYDAQVDVITQLEKRVQGQLQQMLQQQQQQQRSTNPQLITIITKLRRDFERVQGQARSYQESATSKIKAIRSIGDSSNTHAASYGTGNNQQHQTTVMSDEAIRAEQQRLIQVQMQEDRLAAEIMREREEEIRNINRGMHQVNEIYKDLAHIVGQQQEQIDTIETQMDDARANAEAGLKQVEKANEKYGTNQCSIM